MNKKTGQSDKPLFDPDFLRMNRARASHHAATHGFLHDRACDQIADRLADIKRAFPFSVLYGGEMTGKSPQAHLRQAGGIETLMIVSQEQEDNLSTIANPPADAIFSLLTLHAAEDLPGALYRINRALKPDGLFLAALFGGDTLCELRECLMEAELSLTGGASPRIMPFADKRQMGALLQRAGFALPVVDSETMTVTYQDSFALMRDLRFMGESNSLFARNKKYPGRHFFTTADRLYREKYAEPDGRIPATVEIIYLIGWSPHESQQKPLRPGSADTSLTDIL